MTQAIVIFGAAVLADGSASRALRRRIAGAAAAFQACPDSLMLCSGGAAGGRPSEASVMHDLLASDGVPAERIVLDEASLDTLQSVIAAGRFVHAHQLAPCIVCTDTYHAPRVLLLLRALGIAAVAGPVKSGRDQAGRAYWTRMVLREVAATIYDGAIVMVRGRALRAQIAADG